MATGPNLASHWIQAHGGTGDVMNQKVTDGPNVVLDTTAEMAPAGKLEISMDPNA